MEKKYLIDSNIIIEYLAHLLPSDVHAKITSIIDREFNISFINKIEILGHSQSDQILNDFIGTAIVYNIDEYIIDKTIALRSSSKIKVPDAIVAATAMVHQLVLLTRNIDDFKNIKNLKIENPWDWINGAKNE